MSDKPIERGYQAKALLENTFLAECLDGLEAKYLDAWRRAVTVEKREDAHRFVTLLEDLKQDLRSIATTGEIALRRDKDLTGESRTWKDIVNGR